MNSMTSFCERKLKYEEFAVNHSGRKVRKDKNIAVYSCLTIQT